MGLGSAGQNDMKATCTPIENFEISSQSVKAKSCRLGHETAKSVRICLGVKVTVSKLSESKFGKRFWCIAGAKASAPEVANTFASKNKKF